MDNLGNKTIMAENISYFMKRDNLDRRTLAALVGAPYTTVCDWLNANTYPRIDKIEKMANLFGVSKSDLVEKRPASVDGESEAMVAKLIRLYKLVPEERRWEVFERIEALLKNQEAL
jgi:transcriptional regulator with XRE-family HTH domain